MTPSRNPERRARIRGRRLLALERRHEPIQPLPHFLLRMFLYAAISLGGIALMLLVGVLGYHRIAGLGWVDALLNASMILSGMGPVAVMESAEAKVFASVYAIFSGVLFISSVGFLLSPILHRFLKRFHLEDDRGQA
jgi:hypothetical protein